MTSTMALRTTRRLILLLLGPGLAATALELWRIGHHEDVRELNAATEADFARAGSGPGFRGLEALP